MAGRPVPLRCVASLTAILLTACGSEPVAPRTGSVTVAASGCVIGQRRALDRCNDCVCTQTREWQCTGDPCVTCPEAELGGDDPAMVNRQWIENDAGTLCCFYPVRKLPLAGWHGASEPECWNRIMPGYWRPRVLTPAVVIDLDVLIRFERGTAEAADTAKDAIARSAQKARENPGAVLTLTIRSFATETRSAARNRALGLERRRWVEAALIRAGVDRKRIRLGDTNMAVEYRAGVEVSMPLPPPVVGGTRECIDGATFETSLTGHGESPLLEVCRNDVCSRARVDLARIRSQGKSGMIFALPPLAGGMDLRHDGGVFSIRARLDAPKGTLADGDVYRMLVSAGRGPHDAIGFLNAVDYGRWVPDAPGAPPDSCLDAHFNATRRAASL